MKKQILLIAIAGLMLAACTRDTTNPNPALQVGGTYRLKSNTYNTGAFQPTSPLRVKSLYVKYDGGYWADCYARVNWGKFNEAGTAEATRRGNDSLMKHFNLPEGDTTTLVFNVPQGDLQP